MRPWLNTTVNSMLHKAVAAECKLQWAEIDAAPEVEVVRVSMRPRLNTTVNHASPRGTDIPDRCFNEAAARRRGNSPVKPEARQVRALASMEPRIGLSHLGAALTNC
jgi:hypothetical protein